MLLIHLRVAIMSGGQMSRPGPTLPLSLVSAEILSLRITEFIELPTVASLAVCLGFPGRAIGTEKARYSKPAP